MRKNNLPYWTSRQLWLNGVLWSDPGRISTRASSFPKIYWSEISYFKIIFCFKVYMICSSILILSKTTCPGIVLLSDPVTKRQETVWECKCCVFECNWTISFLRTIWHLPNSWDLVTVGSVILKCLRWEWLIGSLTCGRGILPGTVFISQSQLCSTSLVLPSRWCEWPLCCLTTACCSLGFLPLAIYLINPFILKENHAYLSIQNKFNVSINHRKDHSPQVQCLPTGWSPSSKEQERSCFNTSWLY